MDDRRAWVSRASRSGCGERGRDPEGTGLHDDGRGEVASDAADGGHPSGPFTDWPLQKGFDHWYGFHGALTDSWHPELYEDNHAIDLEAGDDYHLTNDLVDSGINQLRDYKGSNTDSPFFMYLALGAAHWPHHVPDEFIERYRGVYDGGWDEIRSSRFAKQKSLGIVPDNTQLAPRNAGVVPWAELDADRQRLFARMQEVYAGFIEHTDAQLGRLMDYLSEIGELDNTLIVLISDNGASPEAGADGSANIRKKLYYGDEESLEDKLSLIDDLGSERTNNHYPMGWAQVSNTPLKWYKKDVHGGGVRDPLIVHWPEGIADSGAIRTQYHHVVDVAPTVLELLGAEFPAQVKGIEQMPVHGTSFAYTMTEASAPTRKRQQYFELAGDRGLWADGWKAVALHEKGTPFENDEWELYHLDEDFSECNNLARTYPDRLEDLIALWWEDAEKYHVLPLDDREAERYKNAVAKHGKPYYEFYPDMSRLDRYQVPDITRKSYRIEALVESGGEVDCQGVLLSIGSRFGGLVLYVEEGRPVFEYSYDGRHRTFVRSSRVIENGQSDVRISVSFTAEADGGEVALSIDGEEVGSAILDRTWPVAGLAGGLHCGRDGGSPVSESYASPNRFTGNLKHVSVRIDGAVEVDHATEMGRALLEE